MDNAEKETETEIFRTLGSVGTAGNEAGVAADVATKTDLAALESRLIRWMVGLAVAAVIVAVIVHIVL